MEPRWETEDESAETVPRRVAWAIVGVYIGGVVLVLALHWLLR